jgi:hypothetical protein
VAGSGGPSLCAGDFALACAAMSTAPHDALFKAVFSQAELAAEELRCVLPPELVAQMDLTSLTLEAGSFVDEELREQHTDLLYSVQLAGRPARVYVLFEHQSKGEWWMALRLLRYMLRIWELCVADGAQQLAGDRAGGAASRGDGLARGDLLRGAVRPAAGGPGVHAALSLRAR